MSSYTDRDILRAASAAVDRVLAENEALETELIAARERIQRLQDIIFNHLGREYNGNEK